MATAAAATTQQAATPAGVTAKTLLCTSLTAKTVEGMLAEAQEALAAGADLVELRIDYLTSFSPEQDLPRLQHGCPLPAIVTYRPDWEAGKYSGPEGPRLAALRLAAQLGFAYVDIELKAAKEFIGSSGRKPETTRLIVSSHNYEETPPTEELLGLVDRCVAAGADIVKFATMARDISDAARVLHVLQQSTPRRPTIALAMGERGQISRLLAPKFGGFLTFGALSPERQSAPGQPTLQQLRELYRLQRQSSTTKVYGIVGNPVSHSRSPAIHNAAMETVGFDGVYVPLLVDDMPRFLEAFADPDFAGFSVTIPHKEAALRGASEVDPTAEQIGAVNTLVRQPRGGLKGYNTDWSAAIEAIEKGLGGATQPGSSPLKGKRVVVLGAGGAGRALAFGAATRGAGVVVIANRSRERAEQLAAELSDQLGVTAEACSLDEVASGQVFGDILVNTTSVGMHPKEEESPVPARSLSSYQLVFDAVYTPLQTQLLRDAQAAGCRVVTGDLMFVGQAADQFKLFTGMEPPVALMHKVVLDSLQGR
ncbi:hypothetical protein N2152v2_004023 [Parachlorella kessleri]